MLAARRSRGEWGSTLCVEFRDMRWVPGSAKRRVGTVRGWEAMQIHWRERRGRRYRMLKTKDKFRHLLVISHRLIRGGPPSIASIPLVRQSSPREKIRSAGAMLLGTTSR